MQTTINKLKKYEFSFNGRQTGAIGIFYKISDSYMANSLDEAVAMLYTDYEHIRLFSCYCGNKVIPQSNFDMAAQSNYKTDYKGKGMERK